MPRQGWHLRRGQAIADGNMTDSLPESREARLAAALRANLVRRKVLSRSLGSNDDAATQANIKPDSKPD